MPRHQTVRLEVVRPWRSSPFCAAPPAERRKCLVVQRAASGHAPGSHIEPGFYGHKKVAMQVVRTAKRRLLGSRPPLLPRLGGPEPTMFSSRGTPPLNAGGCVCLTIWKSALIRPRRWIDRAARLRVAPETSGKNSMEKCKISAIS